MRYWLMSVALIGFVVAVGDSQETKKSKDSKSGTPTEPTEILNKSFKDWMSEMKSKDPGRRETALKAFLEFGPNKAYEAVPEIMAQLNKHKATTPVDLSFRVNGLMTLSTIFKNTYATKKEGPDEKHLLEAVEIYKKMLTDEQVVLRVRAVQGIIWLGPTAQKAMKEVIKLSKDPVTWEVRKEALQTMVILARGPKGTPPLPEALPVLRAALGDGKGTGDISFHVRQVAVQGIAALSMNSDKVPIELTTKALADPSVEVRQAAVQGIAELSKHLGKVQIELSTKALNDSSPQVRLTALNSLAALRDELIVKDMVVTIKRLNEHIPLEKDEIVLIWTHGTIMALTKSITKLHVDPVVKKLNETTSTPVKLQALTVIGLAGEKARPLAADAVLPFIEDKDSSIASTALITLVQMGHFAPVLAKLKDKDAAVRLQGLQLINLAGAFAKSACYEAVVNTIGDSNINIAEAAINTLEAIEAFEAIPMLQKIADDKKANTVLREAAKDTMDDLNRKLKEKEKEKKEKK